MYSLLPLTLTAVCRLRCAAVVDSKHKYAAVTHHVRTLFCTRRHRRSSAADHHAAGGRRPQKGSVTMLFGLVPLIKSASAPRRKREPELSS